jgi:hypothetical protein
MRLGFHQRLGADMVAATIRARGGTAYSQRVAMCL